MTPQKNNEFFYAAMFVVVCAWLIVAGDVIGDD